MSFTEFSKLTESVAKNLKAGAGHLKEMVGLAPKATSSLSGLAGTGGSGSPGGGSMGLGLGSFTTPMSSPFARQNILSPSLSAISTPPPGSGQQGYQTGIGLQGLPTTGQGGMLNSVMMGGFLRGGATGGRIGLAAAGLGALGAAAGTILRATGSALPDVEEAMGRRTNYYQAAIRSGIGMQGIADYTRQALGANLTSRGSDALVAAALANQGMVFNPDENSTYMQTLRGVGNAAAYLNMDNAAAAMALEGLTSGAGSMNMLRQFGIHTSDPRSGKAYTQGQIFEQISQRLTAGRGEATVEETLESIRRGNLGETIRNIGLSTDQQELLKQFMVERARGGTMDLSDQGAMDAMISKVTESDRFNPQTMGMRMNELDTAMMEKVTKDYIEGMSQAASTLEDINALLSLVPKQLVQLESFFSGLQGSQGGKFVEEFVNAMPGAISGLVALSVFGSPAFSGFAQGVAGTLGADIPGTSTSGSGTETPQFIRPSGGSITSGYGPRESSTPGASKFHEGLDYGHNAGTTVVASASGTVSRVTSSSSYGNYVMIDHSGGYQTLYAHLASATVSVGQNVSAGQQVGVMGSTGISGGVHLHFEIRRDGQKLDPSSFVGGGAAAAGATGGGGTFVGEMDSSSSSPISSSSLSGAAGISSISGSTSPSSLSSAFFAGGSMSGTYLSGAPSAKTGDAYVANDGPVNVHAGEAILTSEQADDWRAMMRGSRKGGGNNVTINVQLANASAGEARRLATMVKQYLEEESLLNNMGRK
jgi:murein DD-endopeptidase MepM/ murein hydrolase activator NlpD